MAESWECGAESRPWLFVSLRENPNCKRASHRPGKSGYARVEIVDVEWLTYAIGAAYSKGVDGHSFREPHSNSLTTSILTPPACPIPVHSTPHVQFQSIPVIHQRYWVTKTRAKQWTPSIGWLKLAHSLRSAIQSVKLGFFLCVFFVIARPFFLFLVLFSYLYVFFSSAIDRDAETTQVSDVFLQHVEPKSEVPKGSEEI